MTKGVIQSVGGSGGSGSSCCCWSQSLCYTETVDAPPQIVYREDNSSGTHTGLYIPYTWSPDAPYGNPSIADADALVHGAQLVTLPGNATFDVNFTNIYSYYADGGNVIQTTNVTDPAAPIISNPPTLLTCSLGSSMVLLSMFTNPTDGVIYGFIQNSASHYTARVNPITAVMDFPLSGSSWLNDVASTHWVIGFDLAGNMYGFDDLGNCWSFTALGVKDSVIWTTGTNAYIYNFMGYAGSSEYGVGIYDPDTGIYTNKKINIGTGAVSDTLTGEKRGIFYNIDVFPPTVVSFNRVFSDCGDGVTYTNRDLLTGEEITIPDGATVDVCP